MLVTGRDIRGGREAGSKGFIPLYTSPSDVMWTSAPGG